MRAEAGRRRVLMALVENVLDHVVRMEVDDR